MKIPRIVLTSFITISFLTGCGSAVKTCSITFHQDEGNQNDVFEYQIGKIQYKEVKEFQDKIKINSRRGYDVSWEDYDLSEITSDYTVNALYNLHDFVITFQYETRVIGTATYTIESTSIDEPALPTTAGYVYHYEEYSFIGKAEDFTVRATRELAQYHATFVDINGDPVGEPVPFTINTESIEEPEVPVIEGKDGVWEEYVLDAKDITIHPIYTTHYYYASFWTEDSDDKELVAKVPFVAGDTFIEEPEVPISADYKDGYWGNYVLGTEDIDIYPVYTDYHQFTAYYKQSVSDSSPSIVKYTYQTRNQTVLDNLPGYSIIWRNINDNVEYKAGDPIEYPMHDITFVKSRTEAKQYTITLNPNGGTISGPTEVTVTYGQPYEIEAPSYYSTYNEFTGWYTDDGQNIPLSGTWNTIGNVVATAKYGLSFESGEVPDFIAEKQNATLSVTSAQGATFGSKSLKILAPDNNNDFGVYFSKAYLDDTFSNPNVVAINFDAKGSEATSNFRARIAGANVTYENNSTGWGLETNWKTFSFKRSYYEAYVEGDAMIFGRFPSANKYVMVDNVVPVTKDLDSYGFESGYMDKTNKSYKSAGHGNSDPAPVNILRTSDSTVSSMVTAYAIKSEGNRSVKIVKSNGWAAFYLPNTTKEALGNNGYVLVDFYSTILINSNPSVKNLHDNAYEPFGGDGYHIPKETWVTIKVPVSGVGTDGRFFIFEGSTAGNMYFDNIRLVHVD